MKLHKTTQENVILKQKYDFVNEKYQKLQKYVEQADLQKMQARVEQLTTQLSRSMVREAKSEKQLQEQFQNSGIILEKSVSSQSSFRKSSNETPQLVDLWESLNVGSEEEGVKLIMQLFDDYANLTTQYQKKCKLTDQIVDMLGLEDVDELLQKITELLKTKLQYLDVNEKYDAFKD